MDALHIDLKDRIAPAALLGYLNFSDGRPDPKFQKALNDAFAHLAGKGDAAPWATLHDWLLVQAGLLQEGGGAAFREVAQARSVVEISFSSLLKAYRAHHADLLAHLTDAALWQPFFLARICESVLAQGGPWDEQTRIVNGALLKLNDFVGYRPIALLETRQQTEYYPHERFRPVPLYLRNVGVGFGPYRELMEKTIEVLSHADASLREEAYFQLDRMDELALDVRSYDHAHPSNQRAAYLFGEWDPHLIDNKGHYRRFVVRQVVLDALMARLQEVSNRQSSQAARQQMRGELLYEAAAALAGTILMASGISGGGPDTHDSSVSLATLLPRTARYRDAFYVKLLEGLAGQHGQRLREESKVLKQPFGGVRQALNQEMSRQRSLLLQRRHLSLLLAEMGFPGASREEIAHIPVASARIMTEIRVRQSSARLAIPSDLEGATKLLTEAEDLIHRGIECGALPDPWNIIGFQGLFPVSPAKQDTVRDQRFDELIETMSAQFDRYALLLAEVASSDNTALQERLTTTVEKLATWWDQFASYEVSEVPRLNGGERATAAWRVAEMLARWGKWKREPDSNPLQFWRSQRDGFSSSAAYAQVLDALLRQSEWQAALALLMTWLSDSSSVPLEDGDASFADLAERWLTGVLAMPEGPDRASLVRRFFELLEVNAEQYWSVPELSGEVESGPKESEKFESAYEEMTFQDSADDGEEGSVAGGGLERGFALEQDHPALQSQLGFLATVAELWRQAAQPGVFTSLDVIRSSHETARSWEAGLIRLMNDLHAIEVPEPIGSTEDVAEFDRQSRLKHSITEQVIGVAVLAGEAARTFAALLPEGETNLPDYRSRRDIWEPVAVDLERIIGLGHADEIRELLPKLLETVAQEPLWIIPLLEDGEPSDLFRTRAVMALLEHLIEKLPTLGLIRETYQLVRIAKRMEYNDLPSGRRTTVYETLFISAVRGVVGALLDLAEQWDRREPEPVEPFGEMLRQVSESFIKLWQDHCAKVQVSYLEEISDDADRKRVRDFIRKYGRQLFNSRQMQHETIRGILTRGVGNWLDDLAGQDDAPEEFLGMLESGKVSRERAVRIIGQVLRSVEENFEEFTEYNFTTTQSDYGDNLYGWLDLVMVKVKYRRMAWLLRPHMVTHEILCRRGHAAIATRWRQRLESQTAHLSDDLLQELAKKEKEHALSLRTVRESLEERFVQPMELDRLCALVAPAMREARDGVGETGPAFKELRKLLRPLAQSPSGLWLDAPGWLRRLEEEVEDVSKKIDGHPAIAPIRSKLTLEDLRQQLEDWDEPLTPE